MVDTVKENGQTERNASLSKDVVSASSGHSSSGLEDEEVASRATQIVQVFSEENMCLRKQLEKYYQQIKHLKSVSLCFSSTFKTILFDTFFTPSPFLNSKFGSYVSSFCFSSGNRKVLKDTSQV